MNRYTELRAQIKAIAVAGIAAARSHDLDKSMQLAREVKPLLEELSDLLKDKGWQDLADRGEELVNRTEELLQNRPDA